MVDKFLSDKINVLTNAGLCWFGFELMGREDQNDYLKFKENEKQVMNSIVKPVEKKNKGCYILEEKNQL